MDVITVDGELDRNTVWQFRELTLDLANRQERRWLAISLSQCTCLDATGLGALIGAYKRRCAVNGRVVIVCTAEKILRVLRITGIDKLFAICDSEAVALAALDECREIGKALGRA
jgi:anti-sigma B factor antagonist